MKIIDNLGGSGPYIKGPGGTRNYGCMTSAKINGKELYNFNPETGVLQVSMSPSDLEVLLVGISAISERGTDFTLPIPSYMGGPARFKGVKKIQSISGQSEYLLKAVTK